MLNEVLNLTLAMQGTGTGVETASPGDIDSIFDFVKRGGKMMWPIGICSLVMLTVLIERLIVLRRKSIIPPGFLPGLKETLSSTNNDRKAGLAYCKRHPSPTANVFAAGIKKLTSTPEIIEKHIDDAGRREVLKMRRNLRVLSVIAGVAPLLGLLGTIFGMIRAFETVATSPDAMGQTGLLAKGIYEAMITTAGGLIVAIPAFVFFHWMSSRIERLVMDIDHMTVDFLESVVDPDSLSVIEVQNESPSTHAKNSTTDQEITVATS